MRGTANDIEVVDWLEFKSKTTPDRIWRIHLPFMMSNWTCLFGRGCPGIVYEKDTSYPATAGCCVDGAYVEDEADWAKIEKNVARLTEEDLEPDRLREVRKSGWGYKFSEKADEDGQINAKTRVYKGRCILSRMDGGGCSLLHMVNREKKLAETLDAEDGTGQIVGELDHTLTMPNVCWQLPLKRQYTAHPDDEDIEVVSIIPWDVDQWSPEMGKSEEIDMVWWCVDDSAAYVGREMIIHSMKHELIAMMGEEDYAFLETNIDMRAHTPVSVMPAASPQGRTLIPLAVQGRTKK